MLRKALRQKKIMLIISIICFYLNIFLAISYNQLSAAVIFNLDRPKTVLFGNGLINVPKWKSENAQSALASSRIMHPNRNPHIARTHTDDNSVHTHDSLKTPSIIALENLHMRGSKEYVVEAVPSRYPPIKPIHAFHAPIKPSGRRQTTDVFVHVVFLKVGEIETIKEYFEADIFIEAKWREPELDNKQDSPIDFNTLWKPDLIILNVFEDPQTTTWNNVSYTKDGKAFVLEMRRVKGKFYETMELNDFPFDVQAKESVNIIENTHEVSHIYVDCFSDSQEWELHDFVEISPMDISSQYTKSHRDYSGVIATCCVSRRSGFFAWNVLVIVNILTIFAFTTFAVEPMLVQNRLQLSFILMLAGISFRYVANQSIPKISYLTLLDKYMLISMILSGCITFWHAVLSRFKSSLHDAMDFWAFIVFIVAYFVFQCAFIYITYTTRRRKMQEIQNKEQKQRAKARGTMGDLWYALRSEIRGATDILGLRRRSDIHRRPR